MIGPNDNRPARPRAAATDVLNGLRLVIPRDGKAPRIELVYGGQDPARAAVAARVNGLLREAQTERMRIERTPPRARPERTRRPVRPSW